MLKKFSLFFIFIIVFAQNVAANHIKIIGMGQSLSLQVVGIADQYTFLTGQNAVHIKYGIGGMPYSELRPGTEAYLASIANGGDIVDIIHGERDANLGTTKAEYISYLNEWQSAYAADLGFNVPIVIDQMSSRGNADNLALLSPVTLAQLEAARNNPYIFLVSPKYQYQYDTTGLHLIDDHNIWNGEQHGKVIAEILAGNGWQPLEPIKAVLEGRFITIYFHVPKPPLRVDTITLPEKENYGFEWVDNNSTTNTIQGLTINNQTIIIELAENTSGGIIRYAFTGTEEFHSRWGNIKDSDNTPSLHGFDLSNWLVHFELGVNNNFFLPVFFKE